jgi:hypothetical protein
MPISGRSNSHVFKMWHVRDSNFATLKDKDAIKVANLTQIPVYMIKAFKESHKKWVLVEYQRSSQVSLCDKG